MAPQKKMNAFYQYGTKRCGAQWTEGDWILHQINCHNQPKCNEEFIKMANSGGPHTQIVERILGSQTGALHLRSAVTVGSTTPSGKR